jgi:hypothetical protein
LQQPFFWKMCWQLMFQQREFVGQLLNSPQSQHFQAM